MDEDIRKLEDEKEPVIGSWNYRIGTRVENSGRLFEIVECYYDEECNPFAYASRNPLANWDDLEDLLGTIDKVQMAKDKPVLDLDNWPNIFKPE